MAAVPDESATRRRAGWLGLSVRGGLSEMIKRLARSTD
jgi:hypothetical protein